VVNPTAAWVNTDLAVAIVLFNYTTLTGKSVPFPATHDVPTRKALQAAG
jgi:hypothetical protein